MDTIYKCLICSNLTYDTIWYPFVHITVTALLHLITIIKISIFIFHPILHMNILRRLSTKSKMPVVTMTTSAKDNLIRIASEYKTNSIIFSIKGGGCNGFNYLLEPIKAEYKLDKFDEQVNISDEYNLYVCSHSLMHLLGTKIDWKKTIMGESFHFENPMADSKCGCGTSFTSKANYD